MCHQGDMEGESTNENGSSFVLENVHYIPKLKRNLISLGTLDREGYTVKLQNGRVKVIKAGLHELERRDVLGNKGLGKLEFCENYVLGKSTRVFTDSAWFARFVLGRSNGDDNISDQ
ncbi:hypothetical protein Tco_1356358 [Tanacetum coccineum]